MVSALKRTLLDQVTAGGLTLRPANEVDIPGYTLGSCLSTGGMGEVWTAHDASGQRFAVKLLKRSLVSDAESRRRFLREGSAVASLAHPGIVDIAEVGVTTDDRPFIVMELLEGPTLRHYIREHAPVPWETARDIVVNVARAIEAAHDRGITHRDIKPANIVLDREDDPAGCTVIDFGLARRGDPDGDSTLLTAQGQLLGTPAYMSPEALRGTPTDHRTDIYALGCVAYELLEGVRPFDGDAFAQLMLQHLTEPAPSPMLPTVAPQLREQVAAVLSRALRKQPDNRFATMVEFAEALMRIEPGGQAVKVVEESGWPLARPSADVSTIDARPVSSPAPPRRRGLLLLALGVSIGAGVMVMARDDAPPAPAAAPSQTPSAAIGPATPPPTPTPVRDVVAGVAFTCALDDSGRVSCWGADSRGRLGRGTHGSHVGDNDVPAQFPVLDLPPDKTPVDLVTNSSGRHVCIQWDDGRARCWGGNQYGQLGLGTTTHWGTVAEQTVAALPDLPFEGIRRVVTGPRNTCLLLDNGNAHCLGAGKYGVRGDGTTETWGDDEDAQTLQDLPPVDVGLRTFAGLSLGRDHACGLLDDGTARCWGSNAHGQLGVEGWSANIGDGVGD
ncbi:MAG: protein kinase, partial [Deltaproteobacteria bacterium]|nr:protein kinase [Deltaproteobacteria bacterium]